MSISTRASLIFLPNFFASIKFFSSLKIYLLGYILVYRQHKLYRSIGDDTTKRAEKTRAMTPAVESISDLLEEGAAPGFGWKENLAAKRLLDALVSILAKEYIQSAKENPEIFSE